MTESPFQYRTKIYYEDTDAGGIVYYANYLRFAERARTELLAAAQLSNKDILAKTGCFIVVSRCEIDYKRPARLEDEIAVLTKVESLSGARMILLQNIINPADNGLLVSMRVTLACQDEKGVVKRIPPLVSAALKPYLIEESESKKQKE